MKRTLLTILVVFNVFATLGAIAWGLIWVKFGELAIVDSNLDAFQKALTREQGEGITTMSYSIIRDSVWPLIVTNCLWLVVLAARAEIARPDPKIEPAPLPKGSA
jgi:uncharacterized membrane protein